MPGGIALPPIPILVPIGGIAAWLKSYTNTPALPSGWVECNGQTLSDSNSVYNGQTIPNLNAQNRFLRGNVSTGQTGGAAAVTLTVYQMPAHSHGIPISQGSAGETIAVIKEVDPQQTLPDANTEITGGDDENNITQPHENQPPYYDVVWIMRVK